MLQLPAAAAVIRPLEKSPSYAIDEKKAQKVPFSLFHFSPYSCIINTVESYPTSGTVSGNGERSTY